MLLNAGLFYVGWFACVLGGANGRPALGWMVAAIVIAVHLAGAAERRAALILIVATGTLGFVVDSTLAFLGVFRFSAPGSNAWICPPWLVAIWMMFATTLNGSLAWLAERPRLAAALGAASGPLSYAYGARLGAVTLTSPYGLVALAIIWAILLPSLFALQRRLAASSHSR